MKRVTALALVTGIMLTMVSCGYLETNSTGESKKNTEVKKEDSNSSDITVMTTYAGKDSNTKNYQDALKKWQKKTGYKAKDASTNSNENLKKKVSDDFRNGDEPDVLFYFTGADANEFVSEDKVMSIDEIRKDYPSFASNVNEDMVPASLVDGIKYAVPRNGYWEGLYYNSSILEQSGVETPGTEYSMDEFYQDCAKIKAAGYLPIAASLGEVPHYWWEYMIFNYEEPINHDSIPTNVNDELGQAWVNVIGDVKSLYENGFFPEKTLSVSNMETVDLFLKGKAAFLLDGSWRLGSIVSSCCDTKGDPSTINEEKLSKFGITYCPGRGDRLATDIIGGMSMGYYISRKAYENPEKRYKAASFVEYMTSDEVVKKFAAHSTTALKNQNRGDTADLNSLQVKALWMMRNATSITPALQDLYQGDCRESTFDGMPELVTGNRNISEAVGEGLAIYHAN